VAGGFIIVGAGVIVTKFPFEYVFTELDTSIDL
jgi:hypothetical protein